MKKIILILMLIIAVNTYSRVGVGVGVGSDTEVLIGVQDLNIGVGVGDDISLRLDKHFTVPGTPHFYWGVGGKVSEDDKHRAGVRGIAGLNFFPEREVELYAQIIPTLYVSNDTHSDIEFSLGMRYWLD